MTHHHPFPPQPAQPPLQVPPPRRRAWPYVLGGLGVIVLIALCIGLVQGTTNGVSSTGRPAQIVGTAAATATTATSGAGAVSAAGGPAANFGAQHVKLTVKTTSKECFGSAGCHVEWSIRLATKTGASIPDRCEITYEVTGPADGPQIGTLVLTADGQYTQDEYAFAQTPRSSTKLAAKVTDMECE